MKITLGEWKTDGGEKAIVAGIVPSKEHGQLLLGMIGDVIGAWTDDGKWLHARVYKSVNDLVAPWTDPAPWDWSTTPPWINWIAMDRDGDWVMFIEEPETIDDMWASCKAGESGIYIPRHYAPKWNGSWHLSKTQRPKEVAK